MDELSSPPGEVEHGHQTTSMQTLSSLPLFLYQELEHKVPNVLRKGDKMVGDPGLGPEESRQFEIVNEQGTKMVQALFSGEGRVLISGKRSE